RRMQVSSVFAMGRNYDANLWGDIVLRELDSSDAEMLYEAARAAGELELVPAVMALSHLAFSDDREVKEVAIWSLGEIGGNESLRVLAALADAADEESDDDLTDAIQDAIGSATTAGGDLPLSLLDD
ncbi:MAG: HEAT repeat domain-containing protein, partial [Burkholderiales bacterium]|nr:HEAT repeat domain-containing protein [Anaerolineae bacterium]